MSEHQPGTQVIVPPREDQIEKGDTTPRHGTVLQCGGKKPGYCLVEIPGELTRWVAHGVITTP